jgi:hypothetical protein
MAHDIRLSLYFYTRFTHIVWLLVRRRNGVFYTRFTHFVWLLVRREEGGHSQGGHMWHGQQVVLIIMEQEGEVGLNQQLIRR